jgi:hypothetical protein
VYLSINHQVTGRSCPVLNPHPPSLKHDDSRFITADWSHCPDWRKLFKSRSIPPLPPFTLPNLNDLCRMPITGVAVQIGGSWLALQRTNNNQWAYYNTNGPWQTSFPMGIRVTNVLGETVTVPPPPPALAFVQPPKNLKVVHLY